MPKAEIFTYLLYINGGLIVTFALIEWMLGRIRARDHDTAAHDTHNDHLPTATG